MEKRAALSPSSKCEYKQTSRRARVVTGIEIALGEREAKESSAAKRTTMWQPARLTSREARSAPNFSRAT
jgi:hypothetical protein